MRRGIYAARAGLGPEALEAAARAVALAPGDVYEACRRCRDLPALAFDYLMLVTGTDFEQYFEVAYQLYSYRHHHRLTLRTKLEETRRAVADGADEIDMVIDRGAFLAGEHATEAMTALICGELISLLVAVLGHGAKLLVPAVLDEELWFPSARNAVKRGPEAGLVAVGGDLSVPRLLLARQASSRSATSQPAPGVPRRSRMLTLRIALFRLATLR
mgnify:CR=1 FL=1